MKHNPFSTLKERDLALSYIILSKDRKDALEVLDWIIDHRDHRLAHSLSTALKDGGFR